jgi:hypothetical protein
MVELIQAWQIVDGPFRELFKLIVLLLVALAFGLLPYVDNFQQIGG